MKNKLHPDTVLFILALKQQLGEAKNLAEATRNFAWAYCGGFSETLKNCYGNGDIVQIARTNFAEVIGVCKNPEAMFLLYSNRFNEFAGRVVYDLVPDEEISAGAEFFALSHTLYNLQIRDEDKNGKMRCINGFTESAIKKADKTLKKWEAKFKKLKSKK